MTRNNATGTIPVRNPLWAVLELVWALAISVLGGHTNEARAVRDVRIGLTRYERVVLATSKRRRDLT